ncbi:YihY/virulence factor BrkB family protein [Bartonella taylorii]|uniref:YihY/virulence factor BrkB family protein n=2 Tax=Bartonella taylorii TaxID=33046 RepID=A0A9Q9DM13_BARTA|nr:YihY/virulence factor BrkB family protein [Bartonella taylorii]EJF97155.1 YihY family protein [Bartonella taylorii 8TBB]OPB35814.1 membrane protein [Bartonella taylorii]USP01126.1 YihY/virulence factor BrkB family protein [Bartonella taylorii]USP02426.1 YihY/virulence factor BrkB family protein [Bartonella taylorii]
MLRGIFWYSYRILVDAVSHYWRGNGSAFASHVALSGLLAFFPFVIFGTSLASFIGAFTYTPQKIKALVQLLPDVIAEPLSQEIINVLTVQRGGVLTVSVIGAAYFASNGIEALRTALNKAYRVVDRRSLLFCRFQSLFFVILGTVGLVVISFLLVLAPLLIKIMQNHSFFIIEYIGIIRLWRYIIAAVVLFVSLLIVHKWLPAERRKFIDILPGIVVTMSVWFMASIAFAQYLTMFDYISTYAGLASIMVAIIFLYMLSAIFILGGEINAAIMFYRKHLRSLDE